MQKYPKDPVRALVEPRSGLLLGVDAGQVVLHTFAASLKSESLSLAHFAHVSATLGARLIDGYA